MTDAEVQAAYDSLTGNLTSEQKALKQKLNTELKARGLKRSSQSASDTPWWEVVGGVVVAVVTAPVWLPCLVAAAAAGLVIYAVYSYADQLFSF